MRKRSKPGPDRVYSAEAHGRGVLASWGAGRGQWPMTRAEAWDLVGQWKAERHGSEPAYHTIRVFRLLPSGERETVWQAYAHDGWKGERMNYAGGKRARNRAVPRLMSAREVQAARPGMDLFGAVARSSKLREWHVQAFAREHGERGFSIALPNGKEAIVHQETAHGPLHRAWRATYFDAEGPTGHVYASGYARKSDPPGGYLGVLRRLVREDDADLRGARFQ